MASGKTDEKNFTHKLLDAIGIKRMPGNEKEFVDAARSDEDVKAFIPDPDFFTVMKRPKSGDWLAEHHETGQTFKRYITGMRMTPNSRHNTIYLWPLVFMEDPIPSDLLLPLVKFASIFFGLPVKVKKKRTMKDKVQSRINDSSGTYQMNASSVLTEMAKDVPPNAFCVAGITMCDLYPRDQWNFVFGLANLSGRCGVYSLARYLSNFGSHQYTVCDFEADSLETLIVRSFKTMCHEICHMFGLRHCVFFDCCMNGSNHLEESDRRPLFLCPVCLRKLQNACKFDILNRYYQMLEFSKELRLQKQTEWLQRRMQRLSK